MLTVCYFVFVICLSLSLTLPLSRIVLPPHFLTPSLSHFCDLSTGQTHIGRLLYLPPSLPTLPLFPLLHTPLITPHLPTPPFSIPLICHSYATYRDVISRVDISCNQQRPAPSSLPSPLFTPNFSASNIVRNNHAPGDYKSYV